MSLDYLEKEKNYWLKFIFNGFLLLGSFLLIYFIKRGHLAIEGNFKKFLPVLFLVWFFSTLFSKKFMQKEDGSYLKWIRPSVLSIIAFLAILNITLYVLGWYHLSRVIVYGNLVIFFVFESIFISIQYLVSVPKKERKNKTIFPVVFSLLEFFILLSSFIIIYYIKRSNLKIQDEYIVFLMVVFGIWFFISLFIHQFSIKKEKGFLNTLFPFLKSEFVLIGAVSLYMFLTKLAFLSRSIILGTLVAFSIFELLTVSIYFLYTRPKQTDQNEKTNFHTQQIEYKPIKIEKATDEKYAIPNSTLKSDYLKRKLKKVYLSKFEDVYHFIEENIHLEIIDIVDSAVLFTANPYNIQILDDNNLNFFINLKEINDFQRINRNLIEIHNKLKKGGVFVGKFLTLRQSEQNYIQKYPYVLARIILFFLFIFKRVIPKLPIFRRIYFAVTKGRNRLISEAEMLGRLFFCGFEIIDHRVIGDFTWFIAKKEKPPSKDANPSYGVLFKQKRVGKNGNLIYIYKIRTMHPYSEYIQSYAQKLSEINKRGKIVNDFRITTWGRFLRKYYLDELPMIINLIKGDMKLVGVRPLSVAHYNINPEELKIARIKFKPGLVPPYYADMPNSKDEFWETEKNYLSKYEKNSIKTDFVYLVRSLNNILFHHAKSE